MRRFHEKTQPFLQVGYPFFLFFQPRCNESSKMRHEEIAICHSKTMQYLPYPRFLVRPWLKYVVPLLIVTSPFITHGENVNSQTTGTGNAVLPPPDFEGDIVHGVLVIRDGKSKGATEAAPTVSAQSGAFNIVIVPGPTLTANAAALAAINRAVELWEARISDPITITIAADIVDTPDPSDTWGAVANPALLAYPYDTVVSVLQQDAANESDDKIVASLPNYAQFLNSVKPSGTTFDRVLCPKAIVKAIGSTTSGNDGTLEVNSDYLANFDYDNSDGVPSNKIDFETTIAHEIGHILGFNSAVDYVNRGDVLIYPMLLDLFRFQDGVAGRDPETEVDFATFPRNFIPGGVHIIDEVSTDPRFPERKTSTGVASSFPNTDGNQMSHWKDDVQGGTFIGLMDPVLSGGQYYGPTDADFRALDLIGYEVNFPPTDIILSSNTIDESWGANSVVGTLSATDQDVLTFSLVAGAGDTDNASFNISGSNLRFSGGANFDTKRSYSIRVNVNDGFNNLAKTFTISVIKRSGRWSVAQWTGDASTGISRDKTTWAYNLNSTASPTINGVAVTGVQGVNYSNEQFEIHAGATVENYPNNLTALTGTGSAVMGNDFINGFDSGGQSSSVTIKGLSVGQSYAVSFFSIGISFPADFINDRRVAIVSSGDSFVADQGLFGDGNGIRVEYTFTATATTQTFTFIPAKPSLVAPGWHHYGIALRQEGSVTITQTGGDDMSSVVAWGAKNTKNYGQAVIPLAAQSAVQSIAAGYRHSLALKNDGSVVAWGDNSKGQTSVPAAAQSGVTAIAAGGGAITWYPYYGAVGHSVALKTDGSVIGWGQNDDGQALPVLAAAGSGVTAIAAGARHTVALKSNGDVIGWGSNAQGQLNLSGWHNVVKIAAGSFHTIGLKSDGSLLVTGGYLGAQTGLGNIPSFSDPITAVSAGLETNSVLSGTQPTTWGITENGTVPSLYGLWYGWTALASGNYHELLLGASGGVSAYGRNSEGQTEVPLMAQSGVDAIAAGAFHSMALKSISMDFGNQPLGSFSTPRLLTLRNTRGEILNVLNLSVIGGQPGDFILAYNPTLGTIPAFTGQDSIGVAFYPTAVGLRQTTLRVTTSAGVYDVAIQGTGGAIPEISVEEFLGAGYPSGSTKDFGTKNVGSISGPAFVIRNTGGSNLNLTGNPIVTLSGTHANQFTITQPSSQVIAPGGLAVFFIDFAPTSNGFKTATVSIANNDTTGNENPYIIQLTGTATTNLAPSDITLSPQSVLENSFPQGTVGVITASDPNAGDTHTFALAPGGADNGYFSIVGNELKLNYSANFETKNSYAIRIRATDNGIGNLSFEKNLSLSVINVNEVPVFTKGADQIGQAANTSTQTITGWAMGIDDGDSTVVQTLTFNVSNTNPGIFTTQPTVSSNGTLSYRLNGTIGSTTVTVTLTDDNTINGNPALTTDPQTFTISARATQPGDADALDANMSGFQVMSTAVQADGKILIGGSFTSVQGAPRNNLARLNTDGTLDSDFNVSINNAVTSILALPDGKILIGGYFTMTGSNEHYHIARLNANGTVDNSFYPDVSGGAVLSMALQADGKILVAGSFSTVGITNRNRIARLEADGTLDTGFNPNANGPVFSVMVQPSDGKILLGGYFDNVAGTVRNNLARLSATGTVDPDFNPNVDNAVLCLAIQPDGNILVGGMFSHVGGTQRNCFARMNSTGTLDSTFDLMMDNTVLSIAVQADGKIMFGGNFSSAGGATRNHLARVNPNGALDTNFNPDVNQEVQSLAQSADGKIFVGGSFSSLGGSPRNLFARLINDSPVQTLTTLDSTQISWTRGGSAPEITLVSFEHSIDSGATWTSLGAGIRSGTTSNWQLSGISLSGAGQIRAQGRTSGGSGNGSSGLVKSLLNYAFAPTVTGISPSSGTSLGGTNVTINGTGFNGATAVTIGGVAVTSFTVLSPTQISAVSAAGSAGVATVRVINAGGTSNATVSYTFVNPVPTINVATAAIPLTATSLVLTGTNFSPIPGNNSIVFSPSGTGTITSASANSLIITGLSGVSLGALTAVVTSNGFSSGAPVQVATVTTSSAGVLDPLTPGIFGDSVRVSIAQPDGKTIIGGSFYTVLGQTRNNLARLNADGSLDTSFNPNPNGPVNCISLQADGSMVIGGQFTTLGGVARNYIGKVNSAGVLDQTFNPNMEWHVYCLATQPDGKILVGGGFYQVGSVEKRFIARLEANGSLDTSFGAVVDHIVYGMALQPDGRLLIVGTFSTVSNFYYSYAARLQSNGSVDSSFYCGLNGITECIALQADGKILIGGGFTSISGTTRNNFARLSTTGTLDATFNPDPNGTVHTLAVQADGKVILGGDFTSLGGTAANYIARVNANGALDSSFTPSANGTVQSLSVQADGAVLVGGSFSNIGGVSRNRFAKLLNDPIAQNLIVPDTTQINWLRGGSLPEVSTVTFERSLNGGSSWSQLGSGTRVGLTANWQLNGLFLAGNGQIRARGRTTGGRYTGSSSVVETTVAYSFAAAPAPTISAVSPGSGGTSGGTSVTITGTNFSTATGVSFGGAPADSFLITNATTITAITPAHATGVVDVVVSAPGSSGTGAGLFTYIGQPEIAVQQPLGTDLSDGAATSAFGLVTVGNSSAAKTYTISNQGVVSLTGITVTRSGSNDFVLNTTGTANTLAPGASTTFSVTFTPSPVGAKACTIQIASNDENENPFDISLTGTAATLAVGEYFKDTFDNNSAGWTIDTGWNIAPAQAPSVPGNGDPALDHTPTGDNGIAGYVIGGYTGATPYAVRYLTSPVINTNVAGTVYLEFYRWLNALYPPYMAHTIEVWNGSTWVQIFAVQPDTLYFGYFWEQVQYDVTAYKNSQFRVRFGVAVTSDGFSDGWGSWNIDDLRVYSLTPGIAVEQPTGSYLTDGTSTSDFGYVLIGSSAAKTYTITNSGTSDLTGITVTRTGSTDYAIDSSGTATSLAPGASTTFAVTFSPTSGGAKTGAIQIASNVVGAMNPFDISLTGNHTIPTATVTAISASSGSTAGGTSVTLTGTSFSIATGVSFGGTSAASFTIVNDTTLTTTTPSHAAGAVSVVVTTDGGNSPANTLFTYVTPNTAPAVAVDGGGTALVRDTLVEFTGNAGANPGAYPWSNLVQASDGNFYGMTLFGGANAFGTIFKLTPAGVRSTLVEFTGNSGANPGMYPRGSLIQGSDGQLYGMTQQGGVSGLGTIFKVTTAGIHTTLVNFTGNFGNNPGSYPRSSLVQGSDGSLYGMTQQGGASGYGTVFKLTYAGVHTTLLNFTGNSGANPGMYPWGSLIQATDGNFYGMTSGGGTSGMGTVFKASATGTRTTMVNFTGTSGANPGSDCRGSLIQASDGNFYGMTYAGGTSDQGTAFKMTVAGVHTTLINFTGTSGANPGAYPWGSLIQANDGQIYGTTAEGGTGGFGTVFKMTLAGTRTVLLNFTGTGGASPGAYPWNSLMQAADGRFYGMTGNGGFNDTGTLFRLGIPPVTVTAPEGTLTVQTGTFSDAEGNASVTLTASSGSITQNNAAGTWSWNAIGADGPGTSAVAITATDSANAKGTANINFVVTNVAPSFNLGNDVSLTTGSGALNRNVSFGDPGADIWSGTVNYGDNTGVQPLSVNQGTKTFSLSHTYTSSGSFIVSVTLSDEDGGSTTNTYTVTTHFNQAPTNISLSAEMIAENNSTNATIGTFTTDDPDAGDAHTLSLVNGEGDGDNASFTIASGTLKITPSTDFETKNSYNLRVRTTDAGGLFFEKSFAISITNVNEVPSFVKGADLVLPNTNTTQTLSGWATSIDDGDNTVAQNLAFNVSNTHPAMFIAEPSVSSTGMLTFLPNGTPGTATVTISLTDDNGINGTAALTSANQTFTITVQQAPNYTVAKLGSILVINDVSGNGDVLTISEPAAGRIQFAATGRTFSEDGGMTVSTSPSNVSLTGITGIFVNASAGDDTINVGSFPSSTFPGLTLNGGTGNDTVNLTGDIIFATDASLDVDLQNDDSDPGTDVVNLAANANVVTGGNGTITVKASKTIVLNAGSSFETVNGGVTLEANLQATPASGAFIGVNVSNALIRSTGSGQISVAGRGGDSGTSQFGVLVSLGGTISGGTTGTTTVSGFGGASTSASNHGLVVQNNGSAITSTGANVSLSGIGGGAASSATNFGIAVFSATITAGGSGTVSLDGTGGSTSGSGNRGVTVSGTGAIITSSGGEVNVTGTGAGIEASANNPGVVVIASGIVSAGGHGNLIVNGSGAMTAGGGSNQGVLVSGASINSSGGNVTVIGLGGGAGISGAASNQGVNVTAGTISAGALGDVTITGTGGQGLGSSAYGVWVTTTSSITSSGGNVFMSGTCISTGASPLSRGLTVTNDSEISATGTGTVTLHGTGSSGSTTTGADGVRLSVSGGIIGPRIASEGGAILIIGITGADGAGFQAELGSTITGGPVTIVADQLILNTSANPATVDAGTESVIIKPNTLGREIGIGTADSLTRLGITDAELDRITCSTLIIGDSDSGSVIQSSSISRPAPTDLSLNSGGSITISTGSIDTAGGNLVVNPDGAANIFSPNASGTDINLGNTGTLSFGTGDQLALTINGTTADTQYTQLRLIGQIDLNGVALSLSGTYTPGGLDSFTLIDNDGTDAVTGSFSGLAEGELVNVDGVNKRITYVGGTGNDVVLVSASNADLASLTLDTATLNPAFASNSIDYTVTVPYTTVSLTHTATAADSYAALSGSTSPLALDVGSNTLTVLVTTQDGVTTKTYTVVITRETQALSAWKEANFGSSTSNTDPTDDFDGDGVANLLEFAFGMNPAASSPTPLTYTGDFSTLGAVVPTGEPIVGTQGAGPGQIHWALYVRRKDYVAAKLAYTARFSGDLLSWQDDLAVPTVLADDGVNQLVGVPYPALLSNGQAPKFFEINVTILP